MVYIQTSKNHSLPQTFIVATLLLSLWAIFPIHLTAQNLASLRMPSDVCAGTTTVVSIGHSDTCTMIINTPQTTLGHSERIFLPDGVACTDASGNTSCSYRSHVTFNAFENGATLTSVEDINYVRLNIEHSWLADIYVGITCPNGKQASLMNWSGSGSSSCTEAVPQGHRYWENGYNAPNSAYLGMPFDYESSGSFKCDSTASGNRPGIGWNYCWSNSTSSGITYAPGQDALIYRYAHFHNGNIDSSNVANRTNFYHPNTSFSNLIGCPLNGDWYIEVIDAWSGDNGYIFGWDISLNANLIAADTSYCRITATHLTGDYLSTINDSLYLIQWPANLTHDTTVAYTFLVRGNCGHNIDTTVYVTIHALPSSDTTAIACNTFTWHGQTYTSTPQIDPTATIQSPHGCNGTTTLHLTIRHSSFGDTTAVACNYFQWHGLTYPESGTYRSPSPLLNSQGCDSTVTLYLTVNRTTTRDTSASVCDRFLWRGSTYISTPSSPPTHTLSSKNAHGCDSIVILHLTILPSTTSDTTAIACDHFSWYNIPYSFTPHINPTHHYTNHYGCDSTVTLHLTINYSNTGDTLASACDHFSWYHTSFTRSADTATHTFTNAAHCDSIVTLHLTIRYSTSSTFLDTIIENQLPHTFNGTRFSAPVSQSPIIIPNVVGCDSTILYSLFVHTNDHIHLDSAICNSQLPHTWNGITHDTNLLNRHTYTYFDTAILRNRHGADSILYMRLTVHPTYDLHFLDTIYDGDHYLFEQHTYDTTGIYPTLFASSRSCDSLRTLHLQRNRRTYTDSLVCINQLPLTWNTLTFSPQGRNLNANGLQYLTDSVHLRSIHGIDSLVVMTLLIRDTAATTDVITTCDSLIWPLTPSVVYRTSTQTAQRRLLQLSLPDTTHLHTLFRHGSYAPFTLHPSHYALSCDSVCHLHLTIHQSHHYTDYRIACDSLRWPDYPNAATPAHLFHTDTLGLAGPIGSRQSRGPVDTLTTANGCDSVVILNLAIRHATYHEAIDTFCTGHSYSWRLHTLPDSLYTIADTHHTQDYFIADSLFTHTFIHPSAPQELNVSTVCDSILALRLTRLGTPSIDYTLNTLCPQHTYHILATLHADPGRNTLLSPSFQWHSDPTDTILTLHQADSQSLVAIRPETITTLYTTADFHAPTTTPLCPFTASLHLNPIVIPNASIQTTPEFLEYNHLDLTAHDVSLTQPNSPSPDSTAILLRRWQYHYPQRDWVPLFDSHATISLSADASPDTLFLSLFLFNGQCPDSTTHAVPILHVALFAPNAFTPAGEDNNRFCIQGHGILSAQLHIFNRNGLLVYRTSELADGWDGNSLNGSPCPQGSYVWHLTYRSLTNPSDNQSATGTVLLLR